MSEYRRKDLDLSTSIAWFRNEAPSPGAWQGTGEPIR